MSKQLRAGVNKLKQFYIKKILASGLLESKQHGLHSLTLTELEAIYKKTIRD